ncbi:MAG: PHP domain-containing protein [Ardenticatenales bacterium]|nr:PHP domain-containing protein [Ardenticatenales bacterium]
MKFDLHLHTFHSPDSLTSYESIIRRVQARGLTGIAVTDHNTMRGAVELAKIAPFPVILAEEIRTVEGEVIGYFLQEEIPRGLGLEETIARVHDQGGIVSVPHPVDRVRRSSAIGEAALLRVMDQIDMIEGQNGRCMFSADNLRARQLASQYDKPLTAGSDAHAPFEIGRCYVELDPFDGPEQFLANLRAAQVEESRYTPWATLSSAFAKLAKRTGLDRWIAY